ncbi:MAG: GNAT family N-acetyltransferase [Amphritea sp.]|nr:GNAT family N-acetyltransferase [Amphritea sp.]
MSISIRPAKQDDLETISSIYYRSITKLCSSAYPAEVIKRWRLSKTAESRTGQVTNKSLWVAQLDDRLVGFLHALEGEIVALFVDPVAAGKGVGKALIALGLEESARPGLPIKVESTLNAAGFYQYYGFVEQRRSVYSHGNNEFDIEVVEMLKAPD